MPHLPPTPPRPATVPSRRRAAIRRWLRNHFMDVADAARDTVLRARMLVRLAPRLAQSAPEGRCRILIVDDLLPDPLFGAGYPRAFAIVQSLVRAGHTVNYYPLRAKRADRQRMTALFAGAVQFYPGQGGRGLRRLLWRAGASFDILLVSRPVPMAALLSVGGAQAGELPLIYDAEAVLSPREDRRRALFGPAWSADEYRVALAAELGLARAARAITVVGQGDADLIRSMLDVPVYVLSHPVAARRVSAPLAGRTDLLFVGRLTGSGDESPNIDSVFWFVTEVMPQLDQLMGTNYRIHIAGKVESPEIAALACDRVMLHGVVADLQPFYDRCRLFVAPTRYAAGIPLKVVEAMGQGLPCVATPLLAHQLGTSPVALATGGDAETFARQCANLYTDDAAWKAAWEAGLAYVERTASPVSFDQTLAAVIERVTAHGSVPA